MPECAFLSWTCFQRASAWYGLCILGAWHGGGLAVVFSHLYPLFGLETVSILLLSLDLIVQTNCYHTLSISVSSDFLFLVSIQLTPFLGVEQLDVLGGLQRWVGFDAQ